MFSPKQGRSRMAIGALQVVILLGLVVLSVSLIDIDDLSDRMANVTPRSFFAMTALHLVIVLLTSWRFAIIARQAGADLSTREACRLTFLSTLGNLLLPTSLAGDAGRVWLMRRNGFAFGAAMRVGIFDRVIGLAALTILVLAGAIAEPRFAPVIVVLLLCVLSCGVIIALVWLWQGPSSQIIGISSLLSLLAHLVSVVIAWIFLVDQGNPLAIVFLLILFPVVLLASSVPISVGGWGTRELAAAATFSSIEMPADLAIAMTLMFGLTQVVSALAGTAVMVALGRGQRETMS